jgi:hypothetical protein
MMPPDFASLENSLKSSFFLFSIALQYVLMNKLGNYRLLTRQSLANKASGRWLLFLCALAGGPWADFSLSPIAYGAEASGTAFNSLVPIVRRAEKVDLSPPLRSIQPVKADAQVSLISTLS